ncbi:hypothetical protein P4571_08105 [Niallia alba]|uniref:hypothetical protein n=1 Tax=Niallia alba TaxID=2729105 RepID=UPI002E1A46F7|nr:hypothetical protein [Niallia alba]
MTVDEMIDNIKEGQIAKATYQYDIWYVVMHKGELYYCTRYGEIIKLATVSPWNTQAEWELL